MDSGEHSHSTNTTISASSFQQFTFSNTSRPLTGLCGEMYLEGDDKSILVGFSNPYAGCCKGYTEIKARGNKFNYEDWKGFHTINDNEPQQGAWFETKYNIEANPPIYTIVFKNW